MQMVPDVLARSILDKYFYFAQSVNRRDENCVSILPFALRNDVMFKKSDDSTHLPCRFEYFVELN